MLEAGLKTFLLAQTGITNLIGQRLYAVVFPAGNNTWPAMVYRRLSRSGQRQYELTQQHGLVSALIQLTTYATSYESAKNVAEAVRNEMSGYTGAMGSETIYQSSQEDEADNFIPGTDSGMMTDLYAVDLVYAIQYTEADPTL